MKMNMKMFKNLNNPAEILDVEGKVVEVHFMNDTNYLAQYAGQGYFFAWSSDGKIYKLLVEKGYYEELDQLFLPEVNALQIKLYEDLSKSRRNIYLGLVLPVFVILVGLLIATYFVEQLNDYTMQIAIGGLLVFLIVNIFQSSYLRKKVDKLRNNYFDDLEAFFGEQKLDELVIKQREYHAEYFNFDDDEPDSELIEEPDSELTAEEELESEEEIKTVPAWVSGPVIDEEAKETESKEEDQLETLEEVETEEPTKEEIVEEEAIVEPKEEALVLIDSEVDLSVLPLEELKSFARDRKITGFSTMRKSELVHSLPNTYEGLRVVELQALARLESIPHFSTMRKAELIAALKGQAPVVTEEALEKEVLEKEEGLVSEDVKQVVLDDGTIDLNVLTVDELKAFAKDRKVTGFSTMRKGELVLSLPTNIEELRLTELKALARFHGLNNFSTMRKDELVDGLTKGIAIKEEVIEKEEVVVELINVLNEDGTANLNVLTLDELKGFAKDRKISGFSTMRKGELVTALPSVIEELRTVELKALARVRKVPNFSTMRKGELIEAIK